MKIGIINIGDIKGAPYTKNYTTIIEQNKLNYDLLYWDRENRKIIEDNNHYVFKKKSDFNKHKFFKIKDFYDFSSWCRKIIHQNKYDKLIILNSLTGVFLFDILKREYKNKYIYDIRDYSYERLFLYKKMLSKIIKNSYFTSISSEGFKNFLPDNYNYIISHNYINNNFEQLYKREKKQNKGPISLVFIGALRYFDYQVKIINALANDPRFKMIYHGYGAEYDKYIEYCQLNEINNIYFTGRYEEYDKYKLLKDADIINNSYMSKKYMEVKYAISNKYYDALAMNLPQLVELDTYKSQKVQSLGVGIALDPNSRSFATDLYEYYIGIDFDIFKQRCDVEIKKYIEENKKYENKIDEFINVKDSACDERI